MKQYPMSSNIQEFVDTIDKFIADNSKLPVSDRQICPPPTDPQKVVDCLCDLFLGPDWYVTFPVSTEQVNTLILDEILYKYCKAYKKHDKSQRCK